ncbi:MAG: sigma-54-dependent Fis family transcriptional regulator [Myxococcaceae bacterium]
MRLTRRLSNPTPWVRVDRTGEVRSREYRLLVREGPDAGQARTIEGPLVVGTGPDAQFQLSDPAISSAHLELTPRAGGIQLKDLGSTNGTFIGNARITEAFLEKVTTLRIGETTLELDVVERMVGLGEGPSRFGDAWGESHQMRALFSVLARLAPSDSPVILLGETGVGKEVLARAIHDHSQRRTGPFVIFDCGSVAASLIESELFGHVRGAFTGASSDRQGAFSQADHGTLFLDELGELPLELQSRLLRALEAGTIRRLGEDHYRQVDVRVIAATHRHLEEQVKAGRFRQDLYFRLAVATVRVRSRAARQHHQRHHQPCIRDFHLRLSVVDGRRGLRPACRAVRARNRAASRDGATGAQRRESAR